MANGPASDSVPRLLAYFHLLRRQVECLPWTTPRDEALQAITNELDAIARRLEKLDLSSRKIASKGRGDTKLIVEDAENQVKIKVNVVFRGTVLPPER